MKRSIMLLAIFISLTGCMALSPLEGVVVPYPTLTYSDPRPITCEEQYFIAAGKVVIGKVYQKGNNYLVEWSYFKKMAIGKADGVKYSWRKASSSSRKTSKMCTDSKDSVWLSQREHDLKFNRPNAGRFPKISFNDKVLIEDSIYNEGLWAGDHDGWSVYITKPLTIPVSEVKNNTINLLIVQKLPYHFWNKGRSSSNAEKRSVIGETKVWKVGINDREFYSQVVIKLK